MIIDDGTPCRRYLFEIDQGLSRGWSGVDLESMLGSTKGSFYIFVLTSGDHSLNFFIFQICIISKYVFLHLLNCSVLIFTVTCIV